jgi:phosphocarrier protein HPr
MIVANLEVKNRLGLHARAAALLVRLTSEFVCEISLGRVGDSQRMDSKSMSGILMLGAGQGTFLEFRLNGPDEKEAIRALRKLFSEGFGEDAEQSAPEG